jgi:hypothetical protein
MAADAKPTAAQVIDTQREEWNRVAPAWEKWDRRLEENMVFINYRLVADARLPPAQAAPRSWPRRRWAMGAAWSASTWPKGCWPSPAGRPPR